MMLVLLLDTTGFSDVGGLTNLVHFAIQASASQHWHTMSGASACFFLWLMQLVKLQIDDDRGLYCT